MIACLVVSTGVQAFLPLARLDSQSDTENRRRRGGTVLGAASSHPPAIQSYHMKNGRSSPRGVAATDEKILKVE